MTFREDGIRELSNESLLSFEHSPLDADALGGEQSDGSCLSFDEEGLLPVGFLKSGESLL